MIAWFVIAAATAHPGSFRVAAQDVTVVVDGDQVDIHYYLEAPRLRPQDHDAPAEDVVPNGSELQSGLILLVDGAAVTLTQVGQLEYRSSHTMAGVSATFTATLPKNAVELTLNNGNYPDLPGLFRTGWGLGSQWRLTDSTLIEIEDGQVTSDTSRQWIVGEEARSSSVSLTPRAAYEVALLPVSRQPIAAATTWRPDAIASWKNGIPHPLWAIIALVVTPIAGFAARVPQAPSTGVALAAGIALGAFAGALTTVSTIGVPVLIGILALVSVWKPARWIGGWVALFGCACACPLWPWSIVVGIAGSLMARREEPSALDAVGVSLALAVGGMWALRLL